MDTNYIQEFLVLRETGSFLKAADILGISQPTLSRHIRAIESEIGKQLIDRSSHSFQVTAAGNAFTIYATTVMEAQKNLISNFENNRVADESFLNIGTVHGSENYGIFDMLKAFHDEEPNIHLNIYNDVGSTLVHDLQHGLCDVIFVWNLGNPNPGHATIPFTEDAYVLHVPCGHRLYERKSIHLSEVKEEAVYIRCAPHLRMFNIIMQRCFDAGVNLNLNPHLGYWMSASDDLLYMTMRKQTNRIRHSGQFSIAEIEPLLDMKLEIRYKINGRSDATMKFLDFASRYENRS